jgi:hypothetical protein
MLVKSGAGLTAGVEGHQDHFYDDDDDDGGDGARTKIRLKKVANQVLTTRTQKM